MAAPTIQQVIDKYMADREVIRAIRKEAEDKVAVVEEFQRKREDYLLTLHEVEAFDFMTDIYLNGRDGKSTAEAKKKDLGVQMDKVEKWLLTMLDKMKSTGFKTSCGTVFPTRKESVSVEDFDEFLEAEILRPMAEELLAGDASIADHADPVDAIIAALRRAGHFEFLNKAVNKTAVLEVMGDQDEKTNSRPNPAPRGIKYTAIRTVGVRKK